MTKWNLEEEQERRRVLLAQSSKASGSSLWPRIRNRLGRTRRNKATNYGRSEGWWIEDDDIIVGVLWDPQNVDMFWYTYQHHVFAQSPSPLTKQLMEPMWWQTEACLELTLRSRANGLVTLNAFPGAQDSDSGLVCWRALYTKGVSNS